MSNSTEKKQMQAIDLPFANYAFDVLISQYTGLHYVNFVEDEVVSYMISERIKDTEAMMKQKVHFSLMWNQFVTMAVHPDDREDMMRFTNQKYLAELLKDTDVATHIFRRGYAEGYLYTNMKIAVVERDGDVPVAIVLMFEEINDEVSKTFHMEQSVRNAEVLGRITEGLAILVESRDLCTGEHITNTGNLYAMLVDKLKADGVFAELEDDEYCADIKYGSILHDVGKIFVSDVILNKPGRLTPEEYEIVKQHTTFGARIVDEIFAKNIETNTAKSLRDLVLYHHEKWNGKGYPEGLSGEDIPLAARIMAVVDVFDALISERPYKSAFSVDDACEIIRCDAGTHFDEKIVDAFLKIRPQVEEMLAKDRSEDDGIMGMLSEKLQDSSRRVSVVNRLVDEYESIYVADVENDVVRAIKTSKYQKLAGDSYPVGELMKEIAGHVDEKDKRMFSSLGDTNFIRGFLHDNDRREFLFHLDMDESLRRCIIQVSGRRNGDPSEVIFSFMKVDDERSKNIELSELLERNYGMIECMASEYMALYYVDLDEDEMIPYNNNVYVERIMVGKYKDDKCYSRSIRRYSKESVSREHSKVIETLTTIENVKRELSHQKSFSKVYLNNFNEYREIKYVKVGAETDEPKLVALAFKDIDQDYRRRLELEANENIIRELADDYEAVFQIEADTKYVRTIKVTDVFMKRNPDLKSEMTYDQYIAAISPYMYGEDLDEYLKVQSIPYVKEQFRNHEVFFHNYRVISNGLIEYHQLKLMRSTNWKKDHRYIISVTDVDRLVRNEQKRSNGIVNAAEHANVDDLTGVYNWRGFRLNAESIIDSNRKMNVASYLMYIDVNGVRKINETFGHEAGDFNLKEGAHILKRIAGSYGLIGRVGGDEFAIIMSVDNVSGFQKRIIKEMREALRDYNEKSNLPYKLSAAFGGYMIMPEDGISFEKALSFASMATFEGKVKMEEEVIK